MFCSPCSEVHVLKSVQEKPLQREAPAVQLREQPLLTTTREEPRQQWRLSTAKNKQIQLFFERFRMLNVCVSRSVMPDSLEPRGLQRTRLLCPWDFPGKDTGVGCHFLLQGIIPTHGSNLGLWHWRQILYQLSYKGSPLIHLNKYWKVISIHLLDKKC